MYKVFYIKEPEKGYQIFFVNEGATEKRPVDGNKVYPSRQNAYARAKQLNEQENIPEQQERIATVYIRCGKEDVENIKEACSEITGITTHAMLTIDRTIIASEAERIIVFARALSRWGNQFWPQPDKSDKEFDALLEPIRKRPDVFFLYWTYEKPSNAILVNPHSFNELHVKY